MTPFENNLNLSKELVALKEKLKTIQDALKTILQTSDEECLIQRSKIRGLESTVQDLIMEQNMDEADREIARLTRIAEETKEHIFETQ